MDAAITDKKNKVWKLTVVNFSIRIIKLLASKSNKGD